MTQAGKPSLHLMQHSNASAVYVLWFQSYRRSNLSLLVLALLVGKAADIKKNGYS